MRCVLALDPGGSKCEALLVRDDGQVLAGAKAQQVGLSGRSGRVVMQAANAALDGQACDDLHLVTLLKHPAVAYEQGLKVPPRCRVDISFTSEEAGPLALAGEECGIVIVAGTGARVFGKNRAGRIITLDGLGPTLGDNGSAYHIGYLALRASVKTIWHPRHKTSLTPRVFDACIRYLEKQPEPPPETLAHRPVTGSLARAMARSAVKSHLHPQARQLGEMISFSLRPHDRSVIASLARIVDEEARAGDAVAIRLLKDAAAELAEIVWDVVDHLQMADERYVLVGTGSVAMKSDIYWEHLCGLIKETAPHIQPVRSPQPPVVGIALVGLQRLSGIDLQAAGQRLFTSAEEQAGKGPGVRVQVSGNDRVPEPRTGET